MERKTLNVKLEDKIRNTINRRRTRERHTVQHITNTKWKQGGHIAPMKDDGRTIRITE